MAIGLSTSIADRPHRVNLQNPGPRTPDGDGGWITSWIDLAPPSVFARIEEATAQRLERITAGTVASTATHVIDCPFHPQVTTKSRVLFNGRIFSVTGVQNPGERNVDLVFVCVEDVR